MIRANNNSNLIKKLMLNNIKSINGVNRYYTNNIINTFKKNNNNNNNINFNTVSISKLIKNNNNNQLSYNKRYFSAPLLDLNTFHDLVDEEIELYSEKLEILSEQNTVPGFDVEAGDGVLTINTGKGGTYVINKQTPNRQIWWSSPLSGPKRFDYNINTKRWEENKDGEPMRELLSKEIKQLCKFDMNIL